MYSARRDSIYVKPYGDSRHERVLRGVANLLCRLDVHDWSKWWRSRIFGGERRMCNNCTAEERRPES